MSKRYVFNTGDRPDYPLLVSVALKPVKSMDKSKQYLAVMQVATADAAGWEVVHWGGDYWTCDAQDWEESEGTSGKRPIIKGWALELP